MITKEYVKVGNRIRCVEQDDDHDHNDGDYPGKTGTIYKIIVKNMSLGETV